MYARMLITYTHIFFRVAKPLGHKKQMHKTNNHETRARSFASWKRHIDQADNGGHFAMFACISTPCLSSPVGWSDLTIQNSTAGQIEYA
jgi:hypothetical protein